MGHRGCMRIRRFGFLMANEWGVEGGVTAVSADLTFWRGEGGWFRNSSGPRKCFRNPSDLTKTFSNSSGPKKGFRKSSGRKVV